MLGSNDQGVTVKVLGQTIRSRRPPKGTAKNVSVVLRPEALSIGQPGGSGLPARTLTLAFTGPVARYTVVLNDDTVLTVDLANPDRDQFFEEGSAVTLFLPKEVPSLLE